MTGPVPTTDWWTLASSSSSAPDNPYSDVLAAQPLNLKARASGLGIGTGTNVPALSYYYAYHYQEDFLVRPGGHGCRLHRPGRLRRLDRDRPVG